VARGRGSFDDAHALSSEGRRRRARYAWLWVFGIALGWFETAVVVDLRALYYPDGFRFPLAPFSVRMALVEIGREVASILLIAAAARLSARRFLDRFAAFLLVFGIWDLVYYAGLKIALGWPASFSTIDVLFLIPVVWTGPVWAPCMIAATLAVAGSRLYLAPRRRAYRGRDWAVEVIAGLLVILSFTKGWREVAAGGGPPAFPAALFLAGWALGLLGFAAAERRVRAP